VLTEAEETRLSHLILTLGVQTDLEESLWLTTKLKEINEECSAVTLELQKTNEELARVWEVYGP